MKNSLEEFNSICEVQESINKFEDRLEEMIQSKNREEKKRKKNEQSHREMQVTNKNDKINIMGIPEKEERSNEKIFNKIMAENLPKLIEKHYRKLNELQTE